MKSLTGTVIEMLRETLQLATHQSETFARADSMWNARKSSAAYEAQYAEQRVAEARRAMRAYHERPTV